MTAAQEQRGPPRAATRGAPWPPASPTSTSCSRRRSATTTCRRPASTSSACGCPSRPTRAPSATWAGRRSRSATLQLAGRDAGVVIARRARAGARGRGALASVHARDRLHPREHPRRRPRGVGALLRRRVRHAPRRRAPTSRAPGRVARASATSSCTSSSATRPAPEFHHIGLDVDDFEAAYRVAVERELFDRDAWSPNVRELNDGAAQMYLRDPAGNLVEVNWPDVEHARPLGRDGHRAHRRRAPAERRGAASASLSAALKRRSAERDRRVRAKYRFSIVLLATWIGLRLWSARVTGFAAYGSLRHVGRAVLLALVVFPAIWVLFIASGTSFGPAVDDPKDFLITLLNGLTAAALYFVVASGFTLIFGLMRVVNMAHGAFFLLGGYVALRTQRNMVGGDVGLGLSSAQVSLAQWVVPALAGRRGRGRRRAAHAAAVPALEPGPGPAPGADHDRDRRSSSPTRCSPTTAASRRTSPGRGRSTSSSTSTSPASSTR